MRPQPPKDRQPSCGRSCQEARSSSSAWRKPIRWLSAFVALTVFLGTSFRAGWTRSETDFPNYYTAAALVTKGAPLRNYYDWVWFQKQMNYAGVENQLGGYIPQTPLTMSPMLCMVKLKPQSAKRVWLLLNVVFLLGSLSLLSRVTRFSLPEIWLLAFTGFGTLNANFLLGQYYVFLLFLLVLAFYCWSRARPSATGVLLGLAFVLKLYGAPFALYFAAKRRWRPLAGILIVFVLAVLVATAIFGGKDLAYFAVHILPRALEGETLDPYNSGTGTVSTLLRRLFVPEAELNPNPLWNAPLMFFFLQPFVTLLILLIPPLLLQHSITEKRDFAWFCIALILASPNTASYSFILLLLPLSLLLDEAKSMERFVLLSLYFLLSMPMRPAWSWIFPRVWLLFALFILPGRHYTRFLRAKEIIVTIAVAAVIAGAIALSRQKAYLQEPGRRSERIASHPGAMYSSSPVVLRSGIVYESIEKTRYVLRWEHDGRNEVFSFAGNAFHPAAESPDGPIRFELVAHGTSTNMLLDVFHKKLTSSTVPAIPKAPFVTSPDGRWLASTQMKGGSNQIWVRRTDGGPVIWLTGGNCNNFSPSWELDSKALVFASDCDRGIGLPALYQARIDLEGSR